MAEFNIYCDESCHLECDQTDLMVLGAVWCPKDKVVEISDRIADIKTKHGLKTYTELKWTKVSSSKLSMYLELIDYFFDDDDLHFRGLVAKNKSKLNHAVSGQTHNDWYYKMYFQLIKNILSSEQRYNIFIDHKDTLGAVKLKKLHDVLSNSIYDFDRNIVKSTSIITSDSSSCLQLADFFSGAIGYINRSLESSPTKKRIIQKIKERSGLSLISSTLPNEKKFNIFMWTPKPR